MTIAYLGIGSNIEDRMRFINQALWFLRESEDIRLIKTSSIYETEPEGGPAQGKFLNCAVEIETQRMPHNLLYLLKSIEKKVGRSHSPIKNSPREIDLDILLYGNLIVSSDELVIPHPLMHERIFVLEPLKEIEKDALHPAFNMTAEQLFIAFKDRTKFNENN